MKPIKVLAGTGMLGTGFSEQSFKKAMEENPDVIGCDAGSTDPGPYYLGSGQPMASREATKRDLRILLLAAIENNIPLLVGSAGTSGSNHQVDWTVDIVNELACEKNLSFKLAYIYSEINKKDLADYLDAGKIKPLQNAPHLNEATLASLDKIVGQMGPHPYIEAMNHGAQVVISGRSSDTSIYAAVPVQKGLNSGSVWHAAKIIECGAGCVENRIHPDCMLAYIYPDHFVVSPPNALMKCTPVSVFSHLLYENADPYQLHEPSGFLDTSCAEYFQESERSVKVINSKFTHADKITIRLEGVEFLGYRRIAIAGIRDPFVLRQLPEFLKESRDVIDKKIAESLCIDQMDYDILFRTYGDSGVMNDLEPNKGKLGHEVGLVIEVVSKQKSWSHSVMSIAWHTMLHHPIKEWSGLVSHLAFPFSPPDADMGPAYRFAINHIVEVDDPCELFKIHYMQT